jgi:hypothetical protein
MPKYRKQKSNSQKIYKMKGCNKTRKSQGRKKTYRKTYRKPYKKYLGGTGTNVPLAYPSNNVPKVPNPSLAYNHNGGGSCGIIETSNLAYNPNSNMNGSNPSYPSTGPNPSGFNFLNSQIKKGGCGCGMRGGNHETPLTTFIGEPWTTANNAIPSESTNNHFALNTYDMDISRQMKDLGASPPFLGGARKRKGKTSKKKNQKGGILSNFIAQDFINLGRQGVSGLSNFGNAFKGVGQQPSPMPWKNQLPNTSNVSTLQKMV